MSNAGSMRPPTTDRRRRVLVPTLVTLAALLFVGSIFTNLYTERQWFASVDYQSVFTTVIGTRVLLFAVFGVFFGLFVLANLWIAYWRRPPITSTRPNDPAVRYRATLVPILRPVAIVVTLVLTLIAGAVASGRWETFLLWRNGGEFGRTDPQFNRDAGFYVFDYPWLRFLASYGYALLIVAGLLVLLTYYVFGAISLAGRGAKLTRAVQVHIAVLFGLGMLVRAYSFWLNRYGMVLGDGGLLQGAMYTDVNARIPATNILIGVAAVCAVLFFAVIVVRSWVLPGVGLGLLIVTSLLIGGAWPAAMQSFQVRPSEPDREGPYIARNIESTRFAYDVEGVEVVDYTAKTSLTPEELNRTAESRVSSRLLDPTLISPAFEQLQQVRGYYTMQETLDVGRYVLDGSELPQDIIIAARELNLDGLEPSQRNWANDHTVYTHGYGVVAARGNQRGPQGEPVWVARDIPPTGEFEFDIPPRIYFGENSPSYSIVGRQAGDPPIEVDIPRGGARGGEDSADEENVTQNTYDGAGGVPVGSLFHKVLYAFKFGEPNIVLSDRVNENSKILYDRHPRTRVQKVAPWLTVDGDPFPAVVDGRLVWILDGYTTSNSYPYSQSRSLQEATSDSLTRGAAQATLPTDRINYMRNSVKAVVDAYDGTIDLYQWDEEDPIVNAWMDAFPGTVKPRAEISDALRAHLRYPVDLFKVQRDVLTRYHVTDEQTFYEDGERWRVPGDPTSGGQETVLQPPYYLSMSRPGEEEPSFSLTSVYLPNNRQNLAGFVSVNSEASDEDNYGTMQILQLPSDTQIPGPSQIANTFQADRGVTQALLQYEQSTQARILRGNLLTLPVGDGLLYVQPVYIQRSAEQGSYPVLQFVAASFGEDVGFGTTLDEALRVALGLQEGDITIGEELEEGEGDSPEGTEEQPADEELTVQDLLERASRHYAAAQDALRDGDLAEYQRRVESMNRALEQAQQMLQQQQQGSE